VTLEIVWIASAAVIGLLLVARMVWLEQFGRGGGPVNERHTRSVSMDE
jgi:hypothetical protein